MPYVFTDIDVSLSTNFSIILYIPTSKPNLLTQFRLVVHACRDYSPAYFKIDTGITIPFYLNYALPNIRYSRKKMNDTRNK